MLRPGPRRVLLTGAHRRVAAAVIERLLDDASVELVLGVSYGVAPPWLVGYDPRRFKYISADLSHRRAVENLFLLEDVRERALDTVVHLALETDPDGYSRARHEFNVSSTRHTLGVARASGVRKFVFLSSDAVYKLGPRTDAKVNEDAELNLDARTHTVVRDTIDAEFLCRAKMDDPDCDIMVLRHSGIIGGGVVSGINLLLESEPPVLPIGFDPLLNPCSKDQLASDVHSAVVRHGKGVFNVAGQEVLTLSRLLERRGIIPRRVPGPILRMVNRVQRYTGHTRYHAEFHPGRLHYNLVLDDSRFRERFPNVEFQPGKEGPLTPSRTTT